MKIEKKVVVIIQCRISSTRLPGKALLPLGGKTVLEWTLSSMKKVKADEYFLAVDEGSKEKLKPIADKNGFRFFAGSLVDVLDRFCRVINLSKADVVVRATADNPFLFYEAANDLVTEYFEQNKKTPLDYITYTGLPHGSGVEVFNASSLLKAASETDSPYDHEHVGPALYNHSEKYNCAFIKASKPFYFPELRTTIDLPSDYKRALRIVREISGEKVVLEPYSSYEILRALESDHVKNPLLLIPSVKKGRGTGHLRRCLSLVVKNGWDIYIPSFSDLPQKDSLLKDAKEKGLSDFQVINNFEDIHDYSLLVTDLFKTDKKLLDFLSKRSPVISIDDGGSNPSYADYLLDIIPAIKKKRKVNYKNPLFIPLPKNRKDTKVSKIKTALVTIGGEDPSNLLLKASLSLSKNGIKTVAIALSALHAKKIEEKIPESLKENLSVSLPLENLKEELFKYDLVVTHYGFTAFEASSAGCAVILLGTTSLHRRLSHLYGFKCLSKKQIKLYFFKRLLSNPKSLYSPFLFCEEKRAATVSKEDLPGFLKKLSKGKRLNCPICQKNDGYKNKIIARTKERTFRRCSFCGLIYIAWTLDEKRTEYNRDYFYKDYKKQYGVTYQEDFSNIKTVCKRRVSVMNTLYKNAILSLKEKPSVLDIGCALGPFLSAANEDGWNVFGSDISGDAIDYVKNTLNFPALKTEFPDSDFKTEFSLEKFDALTMWFVIEHFENLSSVLKKVSDLLKKDGIFAFSTPSASGISARFSHQDFFEKSPQDHYSIFEIGKIKKILKKYGFRIMRIIPTGIHIERFPFLSKIKKSSIWYKLLFQLCYFFKLGDTFEVYCKKIKI